MHTISCCISFERRARGARSACWRRRPCPSAPTRRCRRRERPSADRHRRRCRLGWRLQRERERTFRQQRDAGAERHDAKPTRSSSRGLTTSCSNHRLIREIKPPSTASEIFGHVRRIATSVVGSCSWRRYRHCAGYKRDSSRPRTRPDTPSSSVWPSSISLTPLP